MSYRLKEIRYFGRTVKILCQNENGPCPLISICNVLLLSGRVNVHPDYGEITLDSVIQLVANRIVEASSQYENETEDIRLMQQQRVSDVISILPNLQYGLDVNVKFDSVSNFEYTRELDCFDVAGVPIYHGWILDPQDKLTAQAIKDMSYNLVIYRLVEARALADEIKSWPANIVENSTFLSAGEENTAESEMKSEAMTIGANRGPRVLSPEENKLLSDGRIIETFLEDTASQLTYIGLMALYDTISEGTLCAFFRNNHFSTMLKKGGRLYMLVTDTGYAGEPSVVWELLDEIDGNTELVDSDFRLVTRGDGTSTRSEQGGSGVDVLSPHRPLIDPDTLLALQLSQQDQQATTPQSGTVRSDMVVGHVTPPAAVSTARSAPSGVTATQSSAAAVAGGAFAQESRSGDASWGGLTMEQADRMAALQLQEALDKEPETSSGVYGGLSAVDRDRLHAMRLQEEFETERLRQQGGQGGVDMSAEQLEAYRRAELEYFRRRDQQRAGQGGEKKSSSSCLIS